MHLNERQLCQNVFPIPHNHHHHSSPSSTPPSPYAPYCKQRSAIKIIITLTLHANALRLVFTPFYGWSCVPEKNKRSQNKNFPRKLEDSPLKILFSRQTEDCRTNWKLNKETGDIQSVHCYDRCLNLKCQFQIAIKS